MLDVRPIIPHNPLKDDLSEFLLIKIQSSGGLIKKKKKKVSFLG